MAFVLWDRRTVPFSNEVENGQAEEDESGADEGAFQSALLTDADASVIEVSAPTAGCREKFLAHGIVYDAVLQLAPDLTGDGH